MNLLDLAILLIILVFSIQGFRNGIVREVLTIVGMVFALFVSFQYMGELSELLALFLERSEEVLALISATILFASVYILFLAMAMLIRKFLELIRLNLINRIFGFLFGGLKSAILISLFLLLLAGLNLPGSETRQASILYSHVIRMVPLMFQLLALFYPGAEDTIERIERMLDEAGPIQNLTLFD